MTPGVVVRGGGAQGVVRGGARGGAQGVVRYS